MFGMVPYNRRNEVGRNVSRDFFGWDMDRFIENFMNDSMFPSFLWGGNDLRVDIREADKEYILEAEIPGVRKEDINLELRDDRLTISVEHNEERTEEKDQFIRKERRYGSMSRSFFVENVKADEVKARYNNGILTVTLPKKEPGKSRGSRIQIN